MGSDKQHFQKREMFSCDAERECRGKQKRCLIHPSHLYRLAHIDEDLSTEVLAPPTPTQPHLFKPVVQHLQYGYQLDQNNVYHFWDGNCIIHNFKSTLGDSYSNLDIKNINILACRHIS